MGFICVSACVKRERGMLQNAYRGFCWRFCKTIPKATAGCCKVFVLGSVLESMRGRFGDRFGAFWSVCVDLESTRLHEDENKSTNICNLRKNWLGKYLATQQTNILKHTQKWLFSSNLCKERENQAGFLLLFSWETRYKQSLLPGWLIGLSLNYNPYWPCSHFSHILNR